MMVGGRRAAAAAVLAGWASSQFTYLGSHINTAMPLPWRLARHCRVRSTCWHNPPGTSPVLYYESLQYVTVS